METVLDLVIRLKKNLDQANNNNYYKDIFIDPENIHKIRTAIKKIENDKIDVNKLRFFEKCFDFKSIYEYFYMNNKSEHDQYYSANIEINTALDQLCIYLMEENYEVNIRKLKIEDKIVVGFPEIVGYIYSMEEAYSVSDYKRVTTLSSTILQCVFKEICDSKQVEYSENDKFPALYFKVKDILKINADQYKDNPNLRNFCSKLNQLVILINELRNLYSDSHGSTQNAIFDFDKLPKHHIKLIVDTTKTIVNFLIDSYEYQYDTLKL